jgi:hypothetical protein
MFSDWEVSGPSSPPEHVLEGRGLGYLGLEINFNKFALKNQENFKIF